MLSLSVGAVGVGAVAFYFFRHDQRRMSAEIQRADAERQRADAGARFAILLEMAPAAIMVRAAGGKIAYWNQGAEQLYGWSAAEAVGRSSHELLDTVLVRRADESAVSAEALPETLAVFSGAAWQGELTNRTKAGKRIPVRSQWAAVPGDDAVDGAVIEINVDISAEKSSEAALREQSQQIQAAGHIDRIGSRVMTAFNRNSTAPEAVADALEVLSDEVGYKPLALYEYDEWQARLTLLGGLALAPPLRSAGIPVGGRAGG